MTRFYDLAAKLSACMAGVCAILALLATPSSARADDPIDPCYTCCASLYPDTTSSDYTNCFMNCDMGAGGECTSSGLVCWPKSSGGCWQGPCGFVSSCQQNPWYDDYGYPNCCL